MAVLLHALWQGPGVRRAEAAGDAATRWRWVRMGAALDALMLLATLAATRSQGSAVLRTIAVWTSPNSRRNCSSVSSNAPCVVCPA